jgi:uncharacterized protein
MSHCDTVNAGILEMNGMVYFFALLLVVVLLISWAATLIGMPGNWLIVLAAAVYAYCIPVDSHVAIGWGVVATLVVLAALGEGVELLAGVMGTARVGASRRSAILALLGSFAGAMLGIVIGLPIPLIGSFVATLLFASLGAMAGGMLGERWAGRNIGASWQVGEAAFWGRLAGTLGKVLIGAIMVATVVAAMVL